MSQQIKKLIGSVIALVAGIVFIVFGCISMKEIKKFVPVDAVVSHVQREWVPDDEGFEQEELTFFVTYTVDGQEYTEQLQNTKTSLEKGDQITVRYNPENPKEVSGATTGIAAVQIAFGSLFALAGLGIAALTVIKGR